MAYLVARGHDPITVKRTFEEARERPRNDIRNPPSTNTKKTGIVFSTKYNPRGPNLKEIIRKHLKIIDTPQLKKIFPCGVSLIYKRENNIKELLTKSDPYSIKKDLTSTTTSSYKRCSGCDSCDNFVLSETSIVSFATGKRFLIRRDSCCISRNVVYCAICILCHIQGIGSTIFWKPRLANYKSHINKKIVSCKIVEHFIDSSIHGENPLKYLKFVIVDRLNNVDDLSVNEIDRLLEKEKLWIGMLLTQHKGMNASHDWRRKTREKRNK